jgi:dienelactone hydrolase
VQCWRAQFAINFDNKESLFYSVCMTHNLPRLSLILQTALLFGLLVASAPMAVAQVHSPQALRNAASLAQDLSYPDKLSEFGFFSTPSMAMYKPVGNGPFPALVLQHQCGGLRNASGSWQNQSMLDWAKTAVQRGYVALVIDSMGPRGVDSLCSGPKSGVNFMRGARDALLAAAHLKKFDFVDKERIAHAGYSWGAMVSLALSGKTWGEALGDGTRFAAAVSFYPGCFTLRPPTGPAYDLINPDVDKPLLVLMGDLDNETPPADCLPKLEAAKSAGGPVQWHVYPETTHCWDCKNLHTFSKTDSRGNRVTYLYSSIVTQNSEQRMFDFLETELKLKK